MLQLDGYFIFFFRYRLSNRFYIKTCNVQQIYTEFWFSIQTSSCLYQTEMLQNRVTIFFSQIVHGLTFGRMIMSSPQIYLFPFLLVTKLQDPAFFSLHRRFTQGGTFSLVLALLLIMQKLFFLCLF